MNLEQFQAMKERSLADGTSDDSAFDRVAHLHVTDRGHVLVLNPRREACDVPLVCVEMAGKWHSIFVLHTDGRVIGHSFEVLEPHAKNGRYFIDHCPYPPAVTAWARFMGYYVDDLSLEMMVGRWITGEYRLDDDLD